MYISLKELYSPFLGDEFVSFPISLGGGGGIMGMFES